MTKDQVVVSQPKFGKEFRIEHFSFEEGYVPLNHGSFGKSPKSVSKARAEEIEKAGMSQDMFFKDLIYDRIEDSRKVVADYLDADPLNVVFTQNATMGVNTVLRSYPFQKGDKIIYPTTVYGATGNTIKFMAHRYGIVPLIVDITYPLSHDEIVERFCKMFDEHKDAKMCVFDTVTSNPGWGMPWERLTEECRKRGILSLIDGAHGIGIVPISLQTAKPDFFVTNCHKWFFIPTSCAVLYIDEKHHKHIHTMPVSHSYLEDEVELPTDKEERRLVDRFTFIGTMDYSPMLVIPQAAKFIEQECGGFDNVLRHYQELALKGGKLVAEQLGTETMDLAKLGGQTAMVNVRLPLDDIPKEDQDAASKFLAKYLLTKKKLYIPAFSHGGKLWSRWSAQVYVDLDDFQYGIECMKEAMEALRSTPKESWGPPLRN